jgi:hypothetical protein
MLFLSSYLYTGVENRDYGHRVLPALTTRHALYPEELAVTSPTSGCSYVGIVRWWTKATEIS